MQMSGDCLRFDPHLPEEWERLDISMVYRGRHIRATITPRPTRALIKLREGSEPLTIRLGSLEVQAAPGSPAEAICATGTWEKYNGEQDIAPRNSDEA
jgi:trehalose/maltose hydrolase-like predicted phosphorylase